MQRSVRIFAMDGEIRKFECPNPECDKILDVPHLRYRRKPMEISSVECECGDIVRLNVLNLGAKRI